MKVDYAKFPEIPPGCSLNENKKSGLYQVYRDIWKEDPATGIKRVFRESIGSIKDGVFRFGDTYLLRQEIDRLRKDNDDLRSRLGLTSCGCGEAGGRAGRAQAGACQPEEKPRAGACSRDSVLVPMSSVVFSSLMCSLGGGTDAESISKWVETNREFLERRLPGEKFEGITPDVVRRALMLVDTGSFDAFCLEMAAPLVRQAAGRIAAAGAGESRGSGRRVREGGAVDGVKILLGVSGTDGSTCLRCLPGRRAGETGAGFGMTGGIPLFGSIVTADDMSCPAGFAEAVISARADYLLSLEGRQGRLRQKVAAIFAEAGESRLKKYPAGGGTARGRKGTREISVLPGSLMPQPLAGKWPGLDCGSIVREEQAGTKRPAESEPGPRFRYFVTSVPPRQECLEIISAAAAAHWGAGNRLRCLPGVYWWREAMSARSAGYAAGMIALGRLARDFLGDYGYWLWNTGRSGGDESPALETLQERCREPETAIECLAAGLGSALVD